MTDPGGAWSEQAGFFRSALLLGLIKGDLAVRWADDVLATGGDVPHAFVEISTTDPDDLSALRHALLALCDERPSPGIVDALLGLVARDLESERRSFPDTVRVLVQLRKFLKIDPALDEQLKAQSVEATMKPDGPVLAEQRVRAWLMQYATAVLAGEAGGR